MTAVEPIRDKSLIDMVKRILKRQGTRNHLLFVMGINIGLRISDTLKLKVKDVRNKDYIELYEQKTKKFKRFPIVDAYKPDLDDFIVGKDDEEWLFASRRGGKPITRIQAYRILQEACFEAGITARIGTHTLRKTFGYHFYQEHKDIGLLQYLFNHSSQRITLLYIGITQELIDSKLRSFAL